MYDRGSSLSPLFEILLHKNNDDRRTPKGNSKIIGFYILSKRNLGWGSALKGRVTTLIHVTSAGASLGGTPHLATMTNAAGMQLPPGSPVHVSPSNVAGGRCLVAS